MVRFRKNLQIWNILIGLQDMNIFVNCWSLGLPGAYIHVDDTWVLALVSSYRLYLKQLQFKNVFERQGIQNSK